MSPRHSNTDSGKDCPKIETYDNEPVDSTQKNTLLPLVNSGLSRRRFLEVAAAASAITGFGSIATAQQGTTVEANDDLKFVPQEVEISAGETITWENVGSVAHSVTAYEGEIPNNAEYFASGGFNSESAARDAYPEGSIEGGETYEYTFETEGEYGYFCIPHEQAGMVGTVVVGGGGGGNQTTTETPTPEGTPEESPTPEETPTEGDVEADETPSGGQPGFGVLAALGGLASSAAYLFSRRDDSDE